MNLKEIIKSKGLKKEVENVLIGIVKLKEKELQESIKNKKSKVDEKVAEFLKKIENEKAEIEQKEIERFVQSLIKKFS